jgi:hypothetical protein
MKIRMTMMRQLCREPLKPLPRLLNRRRPNHLLSPDPISPLKLQKLLQLLQAWQ